MEGIAKSAEVAKPVEAPVHNTPDMATNYAHDGVPMGVYMFYDKSFGGETSDTQHQLKTVFNYAKSLTDSGVTGDVLMKLREIDMKMGTPKIGESRLGRAFNYAKITGMINNLERQRMAITGA